MSVYTYICPSCSSPLHFNGESGKLECASCGESYTPEAAEALRYADEGKEGTGSIQFDMPDADYSDSEKANIRAYKCASCGAELVTDETTTATECPYCGNSQILADQLKAGARIEMVVPFTVDKQRAEETFADYFKGKRLIPNVFLESRNRISDMRKLYVPYWLFGCEAHGDITFDAEERTVRRQGDYEITRTRYYLARRAGKLAFDNIPVDGSARVDDKLTESLEPYDLEKAVPFTPAVLSGAMADNADVDEKASRERAVERVEQSVINEFENTVTGYTSVHVRSKHIEADKGKVTPALMPVWLITTDKTVKGEKRTYTFAINGQTGALTCDVPYAKGKAAAWFAGIALPVFLLAYALCALLKSAGVIEPSMPGESALALPGVWIFAAVFLALLIAFGAVFAMVGKLKTARMQTNASHYIREDSMELDVNEDIYLYERTERRRVVNDDKKD